MSIRILKYLTPILQPLYRVYLSKTRPFRYKNIHVMVRPGVFYPGFIFSTKMFLRFIEQLDLAGKRMLELGAGSGVISVYAASRGAIVTATDINPVAVRNIRENAESNKVVLTVTESDLFKSIPDTHFDFILIAPPYYPKDPKDYGEMAWYCGRDFEYFDHLFGQLPEHYHDSTQVLMILSEDCDIKRIKEIGGKYGFVFIRMIQTRKLGEWNYIFSIRKGRTV